MNTINVYVAGKVSKDSVFGTHHWRNDFCKKVSKLSQRKLVNNDPLAGLTGKEDISSIFKQCVKQISKSDLVIVYLSDDISVGGSQEILIAKHLKKLVIGFAPYGGKFNGCRREMFGKIIENFQDPFVFSTCDVVCGTIEEVAQAVKKSETLTVMDISIIDKTLN